jgi:predicted metal-dependent phosphoesterase TrpH
MTNGTTFECSEALQASSELAVLTTAEDRVDLAVIPAARVAPREVTHDGHVVWQDADLTSMNTPEPKAG